MIDASGGIFGRENSVIDLLTTSMCALNYVDEFAFMFSLLFKPQGRIDKIWWRTCGRHAINHLFLIFSCFFAAEIN